MLSNISAIQPASSVHSFRYIARGNRWRADPDSAGEKGDWGPLGTAFLLTVILAAPRDASASLPVMPLSIQIYQKQVVVSATGNDLIAALDQRAGHGSGVTYDLSLIGLEFRLQGFLESKGLAAMTCIRLHR